jgi:D-alanyl-lipoteichoic acid acyltransferase DltB (MBOAT superfamily)
LQNIWLLASSWLFYAWWDVRFLPLLLGSTVGNYVLGCALASLRRRENDSAANWILGLGVALNLCVIGVFKYANFFIGNLDAALGTDYVISAIILPLGISFFTFEQISFLVDVRRGHTKPSNPIHYALFVSFFPRLVAGPILRYNEIAPQLAAERKEPQKSKALMIGLTIFFIGLIKKVVLADGIAPYAGPVFAAAGNGTPVDLFAAWGGALAYTCQLYFDFSGYSDMAIGAARCFGIRLPMNFFSPYRSASIIEFWRRWHITLSRFLRDYLYFGLGGNRLGPRRRYVNLMTTMLLGGLWHGASWTFIFWGGLHGCYLIVNHAWIELGRRVEPIERFRLSSIGNISAHVLTFLAVVLAWVFFRSPNFNGALNLIEGMMGLHGAILPSGLAFLLAPVHDQLMALGISFGNVSGTAFITTYLWVTALLSIAFFAPNSQQIMTHYQPVLESDRHAIPGSYDGNQRFLVHIEWSPTRSWAVATGALIFLGIASLTRDSEFLYWQF